MREFGADEIETEVVALPAGEAVVAVFTTPSFGTQGVQYSIFSDDGLWVLTLSASDVSPYRGLIGQVAGSFATG